MKPSGSGDFFFGSFKITNSVYLIEWYTNDLFHIWQLVVVCAFLRNLSILSRLSDLSEYHVYSQNSLFIHLVSTGSVVLSLLLSYLILLMGVFPHFSCLSIHRDFEDQFYWSSERTSFFFHWLYYFSLPTLLIAFLFLLSLSFCLLWAYDAFLLLGTWSRSLDFCFVVLLMQAFSALHFPLSTVLAAPHKFWEAPLIRWWCYCCYPWCFVFKHLGCLVVCWFFPSVGRFSCYLSVIDVQFDFILGRKHSLYDFSSY